MPLKPLVSVDAPACRSQLTWALIVVASITIPSPTYAQRFSGSAFAVATRGKLLTNNHVVDGCSEVSVTLRNGEKRLARVEARDTKNDLALLTLDVPLPAAATFRQTPIRAGEDVIAAGFPLPGLLATDLNVSKGIVSATAGLLNDTSQLQISASVQPGNSGGPLLDTSAFIAGVVVAKLDAIAVAQAIGDIPQNVNFAIKAEVAETFLRSHGINPTIAGGIGSQPLTAPEAVDRARRYTFHVECDARDATENKTAVAAGSATEGHETDRQQREAEIAREVERRLAEAERERQRAADAETCDRPIGAGIGTLDWARMSTDQRRMACEAAANAARAAGKAGCDRPTGVGIGELEWAKMSVSQQRAACDAAASRRRRSTAQTGSIEGYTRSELLEAWGPPSLTETRGRLVTWYYDRPQGTTVVYFVDDRATLRAPR